MSTRKRPEDSVVDVIQSEVERRGRIRLDPRIPLRRTHKLVFCNRPQPREIKWRNGYRDEHDVLIHQYDGLAYYRDKREKFSELLQQVGKIIWYHMERDDVYPNDRVNLLLEVEAIPSYREDENLYHITASW